MLTLSLRWLVPGLQWKSSWAAVEMSGLRWKSSWAALEMPGLQWKGSLRQDWNLGSIMGNDVRGREKCVLLILPFKTSDLIVESQEEEKF